MPEDIKNLIEKIQEEGVRAAEDKARAVELNAQQKAEEIIQKAQSQARKIISEAGLEAGRIERGTKELLKQAGRDMLLSLKNEISAKLDKIISLHIQQALTPQDVAGAIISLVRGSSEKAKGRIVISLKKEDFDAVEKTLLKELKEEIKNGLALKPEEDLTGGFIISYDAGKSHFDFTDKSLAEYIGAHLKPKLADILK